MAITGTRYFHNFNLVGVFCTETVIGTIFMCETDPQTAVFSIHNKKYRVQSCRSFGIFDTPVDSSGFYKYIVGKLSRLFVS